MSFGDLIEQSLELICLKILIQHLDHLHLVLLKFQIEQYSLVHLLEVEESSGKLIERLIEHYLLKM